MSRNKADNAPRKYTRERHARICSLLKAGHNRRAVCAASGITYETLRSWIALGEAGDETLAQFALDVREAEAEQELRAVESIQMHGEKDWRALAWFLERRFPDRWGDARVAVAKVEAEREAILDAVCKTLEMKGMSDAIEDIYRHLAAGRTDEAGGNRGEAESDRRH